MARAVPQLPADDLAVARAFYVDALGFTVTFEATEDGHSGLLGLARDGIAITIDAPMSGHGREVCVVIEVEDADVWYAEWSTRVPGLRPPRNEDWGARTFGFLDPAGNTLFVIGPARP